MSSFSIVIITYNEAENIAQCIDSISTISDDIVVIDAHSTDQTVEICKSYGANVIMRDWHGYGSNKNYGAECAKHDWVFSIDADEVCTLTLANKLLALDLGDENEVYAVHRINHIGQRILRYSHMHPEWKPRLYNKNIYKWDNKEVHELITPKPHKLIKIKGELNHFPVKSIEELEKSYIYYAKIQSNGTMAQRYWSPMKYLSAFYHFIRSYFVMLGFLEGRMGIRLAIARSKSAFVKRG